MSWLGDNWKDLLDLGLTLWGAKEQKDNLDDMPQLDLEQLRRMIFQNSASPYGSYTWSEGDDGSMTGTYAFSPESQAAFDRISQRAQTADQSYQMPSQVSALTDALLNRRLESLGLPPGSMGNRGQRQPQSFESVQSQPVDSGQGTQPAGGGIPPRDNDMSDVHDPTRGGGTGYYPNTGPGFGVSPGLGGGNYGADINRGIEDMLNEGYGPTTGLPAWMVDNADHIGGAVGMATGLPGGSFLGRLFQNHFYNNGGSLYNPADNLTPPANQLLDPNNNPYAGPLHDAINIGIGGGAGNRGNADISDDEFFSMTPGEWAEATGQRPLQRSPADPEAAAAAARERARQDWMKKHFDPWAFTSQPSFGQMKAGIK